MAETKYGKYLTKDCIRLGREGGFISSTRHLKSFGGGNYSIDCIYVTSPRIMITKPHHHEFDQYLSFFSTNPDDPTDFNAEVELSLGEEQEKQIITVPTVAYMQAGLRHGPVNFAKVNKPVLFVDVAITGKYSRVGEKEYR